MVREQRARVAHPLMTPHLPSKQRSKQESTHASKLDVKRGGAETRDEKPPLSLPKQREGLGQHSGLRHGEMLGQQRPDTRCSPRPRCRRAPATERDSKAQRRTTEEIGPDSRNICRRKTPARPSVHGGKTVGERRRRGRAPWSPRRAPGTPPPAVNTSPPPPQAPAHRLHTSSTVSRRMRPCAHGPSHQH